jgi:hypothetical protein
LYSDDLKFSLCVSNTDGQRGDGYFTIPTQTHRGDDDNDDEKENEEEEWRKGVDRLSEKRKEEEEEDLEARESRVKFNSRVLQYSPPAQKNKKKGWYAAQKMEIATRQLAKCKWNLELASNFFLLTRQLGKCLFPPLNESFFPTN